MARIKFWTLGTGDRFRYSEGGPLYRRAEDVERDGKQQAAVERWDPWVREWVPSGIQRHQGCKVIPALHDGEDDGHEHE